MEYITEKKVNPVRGSDLSKSVTDHLLPEMTELFARLTDLNVTVKTAFSEKFTVGNRKFPDGHFVTETLTELTEIFDTDRRRNSHI